ncbi:GNAT family N-acetyltransferase [Galactobacter caseinivorans]|uniref:GNAT family N-acetyltransferase n=1 Tax=Galactobacter caseinivorans TaxID=2676123 RepID=A0A496PIG1_9MICC|nr:GNAT family N-acetyltransferase [Galactobacter caseinivorans]RKW70262.1 GNAT family N-acetyltransferase [Galactobacter caseinivorans]
MSLTPADFTLTTAPLSELDGLTWNAMARLRQDVFVVEQDCAYPDLDGRDEEATTLHLWAAAPDGTVAATLRILHEDQGRARRIGRVATAQEWRGNGLMGHLLETAISRCGGLPIELEAQSHLQAWYERFGFERVGEEFLEDGILHVPMRKG